MKTLLLVVAFVVCLPHTLLAQETLGPGWSTYRSEMAKVEFEYPAHWTVQDLKGSTEESVEVVQFAVLISPGLISEKTGLPVFPNPWVIATDAKDGLCPVGSRNRLTIDFQRRVDPKHEPSERIFHEAFVCREGVEFLLGFYDADPTKKDREKLLRLVLERSVRKIE